MVYFFSKQNWEDYPWENADINYLKKHVAQAHKEMGPHMHKAPDSIKLQPEFIALDSTVRALNSDGIRDPEAFKENLKKAKLDGADAKVELCTHSDEALIALIKSSSNYDELRQMLFYNLAMRKRLHVIWKSALDKLLEHHKSAGETGKDLSAVEQAVWDLFANGDMTVDVLKYRYEWGVGRKEMVDAVVAAYEESKDQTKLKKDFYEYIDYVTAYHWYHLHSILIAWMKWILAIGENYDTAFVSELNKVMDRFTKVDAEIDALKEGLAQLKQENTALKGRVANLEAAHRGDDVVIDNTQLDAALERISALEALVKTLTPLKDQLAELQGKLGTLNDTVEDLNLDGKLETIRESVNAVIERMNDLSSGTAAKPGVNNAELEALEGRLGALERVQRKNVREQEENNQYYVQEIAKAFRGLKVLENNLQEHIDDANIPGIKKALNTLQDFVTKFHEELDEMDIDARLMGLEDSQATFVTQGSMDALEASLRGDLSATQDSADAAELRLSNDLNSAEADLRRDLATKEEHNSLRNSLARLIRFVKQEHPAKEGDMPRSSSTGDLLKL